jgi:hypothetical protein
MTASEVARAFSPNTTIEKNTLPDRARQTSPTPVATSISESSPSRVIETKNCFPGPLVTFQPGKEKSASARVLQSGCDLKTSAYIFFKKVSQRMGNFLVEKLLVRAGKLCLQEKAFVRLLASIDTFSSSTKLLDEHDVFNPFFCTIRLIVENLRKSMHDHSTLKSVKKKTTGKHL